MKVVLDLDKLLAEGKITQSEFTKFNQFASRETSSLAFNLLVSFGVIAVCCAAIALIPAPFTAILLGLVLCLAGLIPLRKLPTWKLLSDVCTLIGSLLMSGGLLWMFDSTVSSWLTVTLLFAIAGILIRHGLLIVLSVLSLSAAVGAGTGYDTATYMVMIQQPTVTIVLFGLLSFVFYKASQSLSSSYSSLAVLASRTSLFLVNLGFWVGSLWGDVLPNKTIIPDWIFALAWAIAIIAVGVWAARVNRRWVLNISAVFGAIHFYTQWFERLGATPGTILVAGLIALAFAFGIKYLNSTIENE